MYLFPLPLSFYDNVAEVEANPHPKRIGLSQKIVHWSRYDAVKLRPDAMIEHYVSEVRPFAMYRGAEIVGEWEDADEILGQWKQFYVG